MFSNLLQYFLATVNKNCINDACKTGMYSKLTLYHLDFPFTSQVIEIMFFLCHTYFPRMPQGNCPTPISHLYFQSSHNISYSSQVICSLTLIKFASVPVRIFRYILDLWIPFRYMWHNYIWLIFLCLWHFVPKGLILISDPPMPNTKISMYLRG